MYEVVVGIDFGTSGTGYAYSFKDPQNINLGKFKGQNIDIKVPTEIILDSKLDNVKAFGTECSSYKLTNDDLYFKKIKMNLYHNKNYIHPENKSDTCLLVDVVAKIFEYIKKVAIDSIHENRPNINEDQIKWIVTVPSIWDLPQKGIMMVACERAGLFNKNTDRGNFLALEPEAASLYCSYDNSIDKNYLITGKTYIVCDLGGGTGDLVTHYRLSEASVIEKYKPTGGPYGSEEIDHEFLTQVIKEIFGFDNFISLKDKLNQTKLAKLESSWDEISLYHEWNEFEEKIKNQKRITYAIKDSSFSLSCQIFSDFENGAKLKDLVNKFNKSCKEGWKVDIKNEKFWILEFPNKIIFDLIEDHAKKIGAQISEICYQVKDIESILYVGGYCANEVLIDLLKKNFPNLVHLKPSCPERAVIQGAVIFGINPFVIGSRKARYTIGFNCDDPWDEKIHGSVIENKYYDNNYHCHKCRNSFHTFIKKGDDLIQKNFIEQSFITMNSRVVVLKFFMSHKENPVLTTEDGVELIGNEQLDLGRDYPLEERNFILRINFGGTYAVASCLHEKSMREFKFPLYFNKISNQK